MSHRSVSLLDLYKVWGKLAEIEGSRIGRILEQSGVIVIQHSSGILLFSPKRGVCPLNEEVELSNPAKFKILREVEGRRIQAVSIVNEDRVLMLDLHFYSVVLEWVREGNVILLDGERRIIHALHEKSMRDRVIRRGEAYRPPPRIGDLSRSPWEILELAGKLQRKNIVTALSQASSLPPELIYESAFRLGIDPSSTTAEEKDLLRVLELSRNIYLDSLMDKRKGFKATVQGQQAIYPFEPRHLGGKTEPVDFVEDFPRFMSSLILSDLYPQREATPIEKAREALENLESSARLLLENAPRIQEIIENYRQLRGEGLSWQEVENEVKKKFPEVKGFSHEKWVILLEVAGRELEVDSRISAYANAEKLFEKVKSLKSKIEDLGVVLPETTRVIVTATKSDGGPWYKDFRYFTTSNGFLVVAGRSAGQNELLVRRYMSEHDIFLHADIHGAPAVVLKTGGKEVPEKDILEAAQFAACYSSAWKSGLLAVDVYWVPAGQVSKKAPSGEYLGKGAFMIYGKRNWVRGVPLELLVGVAGEGLEAVPALRNPESGCFAKLTPGPFPRELAARKIVDLLRRECNLKVKLEDVMKLLPQGTFYVERWRRV